MAFLPRKILLAGAAPFAIAAVYGGSIAFAQSGEPTPTPNDGSTDTTPAPDAPTPPTHAPGDMANGCPGMGGSDSSDSSDTSGATTQTRFRPMRAAPQAGSALY
ncbi:MAG: hypothetical protein AB7N24_05650 [Dehalococcoidia bacterium]